MAPAQELRFGRRATDSRGSSQETGEDARKPCLPLDYEVGVMVHTLRRHRRRFHLFGLPNLRPRKGKLKLNSGMGPSLCWTTMEAKEESVKAVAAKILDDNPSSLLSLEDNPAKPRIQS